MARKGKRPIFDINSFPPETQNRINRMLDPKDGGATGIGDAELKRYIYSDSSGLMNSTPIEPRVNFIAIGQPLFLVDMAVTGPQGPTQWIL